LHELRAQDSDLISERKIRSGFLLVALLALIVSAFIHPTAPGSPAPQFMAVVYLIVFSFASCLIGARHQWLAAYGILTTCIRIIGLAGNFSRTSNP
jgi:hypothetical protein